MQIVQKMVKTLTVKISNSIPSRWHRTGWDCSHLRCDAQCSLWEQLAVERSRRWQNCQSAPPLCPGLAPRTALDWCRYGAAPVTPLALPLPDVQHRTSGIMVHTCHTTSVTDPRTAKEWCHYGVTSLTSLAHVQQGTGVIMVHPAPVTPLTSLAHVQQRTGVIVVSHR